MSGLNRTISWHKASQSGHGGGLGIGNRASSLNQGGKDETGLYDRSPAIDGKSKKAYVAGVEFSPLKAELVPGSHKIPNSWVIEAILLRTL